MMLRHRVLAVLCILLAGSTALAARGNKDLSGEKATGLENWEHSLSLEGKKPGLYNLVIQAKDKAGNESIAGPFNIFVDPDADMPKIQVHNPIEAMRVGTNLNIVGTSTDDDGVASVEVRLDDGDWKKAVGTEYWSYYLPVASIPDGYHKIAVRAIDVNGLPSKEAVVGFNLDKFKPVITVDSHANGVILSSPAALKGAFKDANGLGKLYASLDGRKSFQEVRAGYDKQRDEWRFEFWLDTKRQADGPQVLWFKGVDKMGSVGYSAFLYFVDNTKPVVELLKPAAEEGVHGRFGIAGRASDKLGVVSLSYEWGGEKGPLPLTPGNPYFYKELEIGPKMDRSSPLVIRAVDTAGNVTELKRDIKIDRTTDLPVLTMRSPVQGAVLSGGVAVNGYARDDDGVARVIYKVDAGLEASIDAFESFAFVISDVPPGKRRLSFQAEDVNGLRGPAQAIDIVVKAPAPRVGLSAAIVGADKAEWRPGFRFFQDGKNSLSGFIEAGNEIKKAEYRIGDEGEWKALSLKAGKTAKEKLFDLALPADIRFGILPLRFRAIDAFEQEGALSTFAFVVNYSRVNEEPNVAFNNARVLAGLPAIIGPESPLEGVFVGAELKSARLDPPSDLVSVATEGNRLILRARAEGVSGEHSVVVQSRLGHEYRSAPMRFSTDLTPPAIRVDSPAQSSWARGAVRLSGALRDAGASGPLSLKWTIDGGKAWQDVAVGPDGSFDQELSLAAAADGPLALELMALDGAGNEARERVALAKDASPPVIRFKNAVDRAWGNYPLLGAVDEAFYLDSLEYSLGGEFVRMAATLDFVIPIKLEPGRSGPLTVRVRARDRAGNSAEASTSISLGEEPIPAPDPAPDPKTGKVPEPPKPALEVLSPLASEKRNGLVTLVVKFSGHEKWYPRITCGVEKEAPFEVDYSGTAPYMIREFDFSTFKASQATLTFTFEGENKRKHSVPVKINLDQVGDRPSLMLSSPPEGLRGAPAWVSGLVLDDDGAGEVRMSLNGAKTEMSTPTKDVFLIKLESLAYGAQKLSLAPYDQNGLAGAKADIGFTFVGPAPSLRVDSYASGKEETAFRQGDSLVIGEGARLKGSVSFANPLKSLELSLNGAAFKPLAYKATGQSASFEIALDKALPYARGSYAIRATDAYGLAAEGAGFFYRVAPAPAYKPVEAPGVYIDDERVAESGRIELAQSLPLGALFVGRPVASVALDPPAAHLEIGRDGQFVTVAALREGPEHRAQIVVTDEDGDVFKSRALSFVSDFSPPIPSVSLPSDGNWIKRTFVLEGAIDEEFGIAKAEYAFDDGDSWRAIALRDEMPESQAARLGTASAPAREIGPSARPGAEAGRKWFSEAIDLGAFPDGQHVVTVRVTDFAGRVGYERRAFTKDSAAPELGQVLPLPADPVNGYISVVGTAVDNERLETVEWSADGIEWMPVSGAGLFSYDVDFSRIVPLPEKFHIRASDRAGNQTILNPAFNLDQEKDKPVVEIQLPEPGEVLRNDFVISGMVFDDDKVGGIYYRIDYAGSDPDAWKRGDFAGFEQLPGANNFGIPIALEDTTDNEHLIEMVAVDINGVLGNLSSSTFKISKAEPESTLASPDSTTTVRGLIEFTGSASDKNGIKEVWLSFDSGASFHKASGAEAWSYTFNTALLADGTHSVTVKAVDKYDTEGLYTCLLNLDNAPPQVSLDHPVDGLAVSGAFTLSGRSKDTVSIASQKLIMVPADAPPGESKALLEVDLPLRGIMQESIDISSLPNGWYSMRIEVRDKADNVGYVARNVQVADLTKAEKCEILYPVMGETASGYFTLSGRVHAQSLPEKVALYVDKKLYGSLAVNKYGYFSVDIGPDELSDGVHEFVAESVSLDGKSLRSLTHTLIYARQGPWIRVDTFKPGDFLTERPFVEGKAGFYLDPVAKDSPEFEAYRKKLEGARIERVLYSYDNGKSFAEAQGGDAWKFRVETQSFPDGPLYLILKAVFASGEVAVAKAVYIVDQSPPEVVLLEPGEGSRFDDKIRLVGVASDNNELESIEVAFRTGDKASYSVPSFIQGLYLDGHFMGGTDWEAGLGLTFFDDNVKLQFMVGESPEQTESGGVPRFNGYVLGGKLIANVLSLPFSWFLGPDWDFFSMSLGIGASFTYFTNEQGVFSFTDKGAILGAVIGQWEFAKFFFKDWDFFRSVGLYAEGQVWFISSDVSPGQVWQLAFGARLNIF
jgi:hypothetical protein